MNISIVLQLTFIYIVTMTTKKKQTDLLRRHGIQPSIQRLAIADHVLNSDSHPTADEIFQAVSETLPVVSRATVYNTLRLFMEKGLVSAYKLEDGPTVYDANTQKHHHLIDADSDTVIDIPWEAVELQDVPELADYDIVSCTVIIRGRKRTISED